MAVIRIQGIKVYDYKDTEYLGEKLTGYKIMKSTLRIQTIGINRIWDLS